MSVSEDNRELFSTLSDLVAEWGLDVVVQGLIDVCEENASGCGGQEDDNQTAWEENGSRLERALDKFYHIEPTG